MILGGLVVCAVLFVTWLSRWYLSGDPALLRSSVTEMLEAEKKNFCMIGESHGAIVAADFPVTEHARRLSGKSRARLAWHHARCVLRLALSLAYILANARQNESFAGVTTRKDLAGSLGSRVG